MQQNVGSFEPMKILERSEVVALIDSAIRSCRLVSFVGPSHEERSNEESSNEKGFKNQELMMESLGHGR